MADLESGLGGARDQVCATGARNRPLEDLQLTTGEGPCLDAYSSGGDPEAPIIAPTDPTDPTAGDVGRDSGGLPEENPGWMPDVHAEVHQASGMVSAPAGIGVEDALLHIRSYAIAHGEPITDVARRVVGRELVLDGDDP